jgi:hypothetical protein
MVNIQNIHLAYGLQCGQGRFIGSGSKFALNQYVTLTKSLPLDGVLVMGYYKENRSYAGPGKASGLMYGVDCPITHKFHFMADAINGTSSGAQQVVGFTYAVSHLTILSLGLSKPTSTRRFSGLVFEYTLL